MTDNLLTIDMLRHVPVFNRDGRWYGREVDFDLTSPSVVAYFNLLSQVLPSDPETAQWYSSGFPRSHEMSIAILKATGKIYVPEIIVEEGFGEQKYGIMEGMTAEEAKANPLTVSYLRDLWNNPPPDGESLSIFQRRIGETLDKVVRQTPSHIKNLVIAAHGGTNMAALAHVTERRMIDIFMDKKLKLAPSFSYMSRLTFTVNRDTLEYGQAFEYESGLPKAGLHL